MTIQSLLASLRLPVDVALAAMAVNDTCHEAEH